MKNLNKFFAIFIAMILFFSQISFAVESEESNITNEIFTYDEEFFAATPAAVSVFYENILPPIFSHESGFFNSAIILTIESHNGAEIFYTLDGSPPTANSTRYNGAIFVAAPPPRVALYGGEIVSGAQVFSIRAVAVMGGAVSEIVTRNFVMGTDVFSRFCENTLVFALNSDPHGLYDHH
ncbi:MAG: chitobiase/beta-hexosaminidase C-terminal domain-containing protein, partial [Defluviitaleaceae bacterium]|nr:chitobiase/beta-hexosaminidase C-terminal domain-containing protein [Defluviitaleaceae bacterium]